MCLPLIAIKQQVNVDLRNFFHVLMIAAVPFLSIYYKNPKKLKVPSTKKLPHPLTEGPQIRKFFVAPGSTGLPIAKTTALALFLPSDPFCFTAKPTRGDFLRNCWAHRRRPAPPP